MELGKIDEDDTSEMRKRLLMELERLLPRPTVVPERRLQYHVETVVTSRIDSCVYHNLPVAVSLYQDNCCSRDQIPMETVQVLEDGKPTLKHTLQSPPVSLLAWSPDNTKLLTCGNAEVLELWDVETGVCKHTLYDPALLGWMVYLLPAYIIRSCFAGLDGLFIASSSEDAQVYIWNRRNPTFQAISFCPC